MSAESAERRSRSLQVRPTIPAAAVTRGDMAVVQGSPFLAMDTWIQPITLSDDLNNSKHFVQAVKLAQLLVEFLETKGVTVSAAVLTNAAKDKQTHTEAGFEEPVVKVRRLSGPSKGKQKKLPVRRKGPVEIRMMQERMIWDLVAAFRDTEVRGMTWGDLATLSPQVYAALMKAHHDYPVRWNFRRNDDGRISYSQESKRF
ncbi:hypothetical protein MMC09_003628 [Bachmanniomyces sp. S44760]|nr:hypothetical protein [Bachmanniomyces sp. S44760]